MRPKYIAHLVHGYLGHTLNWIYTQFKYVRDFTPYVMASRTINLDCYPVELIFASRPHEEAGAPMSPSERIVRRLGIMPRMDFRCFSSALAKYPPLFIHAHFGWDGFFALGLKKKHKLPLVTRFYGYDVGILPRIPLWQRRYRRLFSEGDLFIVEGSNMKSILVNIGCPSEKIVIHHLGVELDEIKYAGRHPLPGVTRILIAGTFTGKKGVEYAIRGLAGAKEKMHGSKILITIIGDGVLKPRLHSVARDLGIWKDITWMGYQPHSAFVKALYEADIFLSPSVTADDGDTEGGAPVAIIEAGASGLPVISTTHADIPEVVLDGRTGILAPERDARSLADAICLLANNPVKRAEFGKTAREHINKNYDALRQGEELAKIYSAVAKKSL